MSGLSVYSSYTFPPVLGTDRDIMKCHHVGCGESEERYARQEVYGGCRLVS
jgi:hypothetical protein